MVFWVGFLVFFLVLLRFLGFYIGILWLVFVCNFSKGLMRYCGMSRRSPQKWSEVQKDVHGPSPNAVSPHG